MPGPEGGRGGRCGWFREKKKLEKEEMGRRASSNRRCCPGLVLTADSESWTPVLVPKGPVEQVQIRGLFGGLCNIPGSTIDPDVLCEAGRIGTICRPKTEAVGLGRCRGELVRFGAASVSAAPPRPEPAAWRGGGMWEHHGHPCTPDQGRFLSRDDAQRSLSAPPRGPRSPQMEPGWGCQAKQQLAEGPSGAGL